MTTESRGYTIVRSDQVSDTYQGSDVPGEFRSLTEALHATQLAATLIRVPPHSDFEQGTGHRHHAIEELYLVTRGTLTMRFGEEIREVGEGSIVRVSPETPRSHRNKGDEPVELWAFSLVVEDDQGVKIEDFWTASPEARQSRPPSNA